MQLLKTFIPHNLTCLLICLPFIIQSVFPPGSLASDLIGLPPPGTMVKPSPVFNPTTLKGIKVYPQDPLRFDFIIDKGDDQTGEGSLGQESLKLIKYFLTSLTIPEEDLWVNLSPHESDRIIPERFSHTEMGRDLLAQDYLLKQLTASLLYPEEELGGQFWDRIYQKAEELYGTTQVPIDTFHKVWIVPDEAVVYENGQTAYIIRAGLKVMLEQDYFAFEQSRDDSKLNVGRPQLDVQDLNNQNALNIERPTLNVQRPTTNKFESEILRELILPEIEREVNQGAQFAKLRQIYHAFILAVWYKQSLKNGLLSRVYVEQAKVKGIDIQDRTIKEKIYQRYLESYQKGVFNYIKEEDEYFASTKPAVPRKYFSGGVVLPSALSDGRELLERRGPRNLTPGDLALLSRDGRLEDQFTLRSIKLSPMETGEEGFPSQAADPAILIDQLAPPERSETSFGRRGSYSLEEILIETPMFKIYRGMRSGFEGDPRVFVKVFNIKSRGHERFIKDWKTQEASRYRKIAKSGNTLLQEAFLTMLEEGEDYIVFAHREGVPLRDFMQEHPQFPFQERIDLMLELGEEVALGLMLFHEHVAALHGTFNPKNVMVQKLPNGVHNIWFFNVGFPLDITRRDLVDHRDLLLTEGHYTSPEQILNLMRESDFSERDAIFLKKFYEELDGLSVEDPSAIDTYRWGLMLYKLMTGETAFLHSSDTGLSVIEYLKQRFLRMQENKGIPFFLRDIYQRRLLHQMPLVIPDPLREILNPVLAWGPEERGPFIEVSKSLVSLRKQRRDEQQRRGEQAFLKPGREIGLYRLIRPLGSGTFASVHLAEKIGTHGTNRFVALKITIESFLRLRGTDPQDDHLNGLTELRRNHRRVYREIDIFLKAQEEGVPGMIPILDHGETEDGYIYIAFPYQEVLSLEELLENRDRWSPEKLEALMLEVMITSTQTLAWLHQKGWAHRDIAPNNFLIPLWRKDLGHRGGWVIDLGIARVINGKDSLDIYPNQEGPPVIGNVAFMAPEQLGAIDFPVDHRTDIHALGLLAYYILTGDIAYYAVKERSPRKQLLIRSENILNGPDSLSHLSGSSVMIPEALQKILFKALAVNPNERYQLVEQMEADLVDYARERGLVELVRGLSSTAAVPAQNPAVPMAVPQDSAMITHQTSVMPEVGHQLDGMTITEKLGEGATAWVFRARKEGRTLIVKYLRPLVDELTRRMVGREIILSREIIRSSYLKAVSGGLLLPRLMDVDGQYISSDHYPAFRGNYIIYEDVGGTSLDKILARQLTPGQRWGLAKTVALDVSEGLDHLHRINSPRPYDDVKGWVHREVKPASIIIFQHQGQQRAALSDLGNAFRIGQQDLLDRLGDSQDRFSSPTLTPPYSAPEQLNPDDFPPSGKTDVFILALVLYEILRGKQFFQSYNDLLTYKASPAHYFNVRIPQDDPLFSAELRGILRDMLQLDPERRLSMQSAGYLLTQFFRTDEEERRFNYVVAFDPEETDPSPNAQVAVSDGAMMATATTLRFLQEGELIDGYQVTEILQKGSQSDVVRAHQVGTDQSVVIKYFKRASLEEEQLITVERELEVSRDILNAQILQKESFPVLTPVLTVTDDYIVFEDLKAQPLDDVLDDPRLSLEERWEIALALAIDGAHGLALLHQLGWVHRDIKPGNLLVVRRDGQLRISVSDLGIALHIGDHDHISIADGLGDRTTTTAMGTPAYMHPSQFKPDPVARRGIDVYSLGLVIYEVLVGERVFKTPADVFFRKGWPPFHFTEASALIPSGFKEMLIAATSTDLDHHPQAADLREKAGLYRENADNRDFLQYQAAFRELPDVATLSVLGQPPRRGIVAKDLGGIALDSNQLQLKVNKQTMDSLPSIDPAVFQNLKSTSFEGFIPVPLQTSPVGNLFSFLNMSIEDCQSIFFAQPDSPCQELSVSITAGEKPVSQLVEGY